MSKEQMDVYFDALNDIPFDVLKSACKRAIQEQTENWLPAVGRIRALASEAMNGLLPLAGQEWNAVLTAVRRFGYLRPGEAMATLSPIAQQAVRSIGGFLAICDADKTQILFAQFRGAYEAAAARESQFRQLSESVRPRIESNSPLLSVTSDIDGRLKIGVNQR
jgi:hypothetical protein